MELSHITFIVIVFMAVTYGAPDFTKTLINNFAKNIENIGTNDGHLRIVGGVEVVPNSFPYQVGLVCEVSEDSRQLCGGSLISDKFVLTAAHCVQNVERITIFLGAHTIQTPEDGRMEQTVNSSNIIIHEDWDPNFFMNDIALIALQHPVQFNEKIQPIALPQNEKLSRRLSGTLATASGWGKFSDTEGISSFLRAVNLTIISKTECKETFDFIIRRSNICTSGDNQKSVCLGDSGGPLAILGKEDKPILVGITSFGAPFCELGLPQVFTKVSSYLDWIDEMTEVIDDGTNVEMVFQ